MEEHMEHNLQDTIALLTRTPAVLNALLRDQPEAWTLADEGENTWNSFQIVGHLVHCERTDFMERVRIVLHSGESRSFDPLDRWGFISQVEGRPLGELLDEFARLRTENLVALHTLKLQQMDLERRGLHPALGAVTLSQLLATWATHDLSHLHQISRVMAHQYRQAVGPWSEYLGVLQCAGHSS
jgi:DinB superfamily